MKKTELLKQIKALQDEVDALKARVASLEVNKRDMNLYPQYIEPGFPRDRSTGTPAKTPYPYDVSYFAEINRARISDADRYM